MVEGNIRPLGICSAVPVHIDEVLCEEVTLQHVLLVLLSIQHGGDLGEGLVSPLEVIGNLTHASLTLLSSDQYHTVTSLCTVDGCRGSVLQDFHRGDGCRVDTTDITQTYTVDYIERLRTYIRGITAHTYGR